MEEKRTDWTGEEMNIRDMSAEHIINAINYIRNNYDDMIFDYISQEDWEWADEFDKKIKWQYLALISELVVRLWMITFLDFNPLELWTGRIRS